MPHPAHRCFGVVALLLTSTLFGARTGSAQVPGPPPVKEPTRPRDTVYVELGSGRGIYGSLTGRLVEIATTYLRIETDSGPRLVIPRVVRRVIFDSSGHLQWSLTSAAPASARDSLRAIADRDLRASRATLNQYWNREKSPIVATLQDVKIPGLSLEFLNDLSPTTANSLAGLALLLLAGYLANRGYDAVVVGRAARDLSNTKAKVDLAKARQELAALIGERSLPESELASIRLLLGHVDAPTAAKPSAPRFTWGFGIWRSRDRAALTDRLDKTWERRALRTRETLRLGFHPIWWILLIAQGYAAAILFTLGVELVVTPAGNVIDTDASLSALGQVLGGTILGVMCVNAGWNQLIRIRSIFRARRAHATMHSSSGPVAATT